MSNARNAWGEPVPPNPVTAIIATRSVQFGVPAALMLAALAPRMPRERWVPLLVGTGLGISAGLAAYFVATFSARFPYPGCPMIVRLPAAAGRAVALTFDDGPHPETTPRILEALAAADARATFFLVGERAARYPELTRRIIAAGHGIGIHGLHHRTMALQSGAQVSRDLDEAVAQIEEACGCTLPRPLLLRPPYGFKTATLCRIAGKRGFTLAAWTLDPRDYDAIDADRLLQRIADRLGAGDIVLLHERPDLPAAVDALPRLLALCRSRNLQPVVLTPS